MIYGRKAHYHETDQMGIVHHSNYIKWFEEARIQMMQEAGISYKKMEEQGILSPVVGVSCQYKSMVEFDDEVLIEVSISSYNGIKFSVSYKVTDQSGDRLHATGQSDHCFINKQKKIVSLKKSATKLHLLFMTMMAA